MWVVLLNTLLLALYILWQVHHDMLIYLLPRFLLFAESTLVWWRWASVVLANFVSFWLSFVCSWAGAEHKVLLKTSALFILSDCNMVWWSMFFFQYSIGFQISIWRSKKTRIEDCLLFYCTYASKKYIYTLFSSFCSFQPAVVFRFRPFVDFLLVLHAVFADVLSTCTIFSHKSSIWSVFISSSWVYPANYLKKSTDSLAYLE